MARRTSALLRTVVLARTVFVLGPVVLHAQDVALSGTVTDPTDAVLPGVTVTAVHTATGNTFVGVTDTSGTYQITTLRAGSYTIKVELPGSSSVRRENVELLIGQHAQLNVKLTVGSLEESITVGGTVPLVDLSQSKVSGNIDQRQITELPLNGRNWLELTLLAPGSRANAVTNSPFGNTGAFQLNVDGQ